MMKKTFSHRNEEEYTIHCDTCREPTPQQKHKTAGEASDHARKAEFTTRFAHLTAPASWHCPKCVTPPAVA